MNFLIVYFLTLFFLVDGQKSNSSSVKSVLPSECGTARINNITKRIINGEEAYLGQFPWMVRIGFRKDDIAIFFCGGSLISQYYVITAAHCEDSNGNIVRLGENYLNTDEDCDGPNVCAPPPQDIKIEKFTVHNRYCAIRSENDFALITLAKAADVNEFVRPICLPSGPLSHEDLMNETLTISGWGLTGSRPIKFPNNLMYITAPVLKREECNAIYAYEVTDSQLCIGYRKGKDSCNGDSGGPVVKTIVENGVSRSYLVGVVSYGLVYCGNGPAVYTDVSYFMPWTKTWLTKE